MNIILRPYQTESIRLLRESFRTNKRVLLVLPCGSGKTIIFSQMVKMAFDKNNQVIIATDRIELLTQTLDAISQHGISPQIITAKTKTFSPHAIVTICMVETLTRRIKEWAKDFYSPKLLIIDEAHLGNFFKLIDAFPQAKCIGATATPIHKKLSLYYSDIVANTDISELISCGHLAPCKAFMMQDDLSDIKIKGDEYEEKSLFAHYNKSKLYHGVVEKYKEKTPNKKSLVYCVNISHSLKMTEEFNLAGIHAECVTSETPMDERKRILNDFARGYFKILVNCGCLTKGYSESSVEVVIINRATKSTVLWIQMCGRGSRPHPNKPFFTCLDFGNNHIEHGLWQQDREWDLKPPNKKKKTGVMPIKSCPKCSAVLPASTIKCPYCGCIMERKTNALLNGVLVEIASNVPEGLQGKRVSELSVDDLIKLHKVNKYKRTFLWRVLRAKGLDAVSEYANKVGYRNGWIWNQGQKLEDCKYHDYILK